jgi:hypothetical protein
LFSLKGYEGKLKRRVTLWNAASLFLLFLAETSYNASAQVESYSYFKVLPQDEQILVRANELLGSFSDWNQIDDRQCGDDEKEGKRSLFCALLKACLEIVGVYDPRLAAFQEVRRVIEELTPGQRYKHPIMNFNNEANSRFSDIKLVLSLALQRIHTQLKIAK